MNNELNLKNGIFDGFTDNQLLILFKNIGPSSKERERALVQELLHRYFNEGKRFNLYRYLKGHHHYFAYTIHMELTKEFIEIPNRDLEDFSSNLLEFIEFIDSQVKKNPDLTMEWSIHELEGIKNMIDRIRKIQMLDSNLKQKMNLFVDNVNGLRRDALLKLEEKKNNKMELVVVDDKTVAILKEEIKKISIPLSKLRKDDFLKMAEELNLYYEEDKKKIIKHGLKKYEYDFLKHNAYEAFKLIVSGETVPNYDIFSLLSSIFSKSSRRYQRSDEYSMEEYLYKTIEFLKKHLNENEIDKVMKKLCGNAKFYIVDEFLKYHDKKIQYALSHPHTRLSEIMNDKIDKEEHRTINIVYMKEEGKYVFSLKDSKHYYHNDNENQGFVVIKDLLDEIKKSTFLDGSINKNELLESYQKIKRKFYTLIIDRSVLEFKNVPHDIIRMIEKFTMNKITGKLLIEDEKRFLFTELDGFKWLDKHVINSFYNPQSFGRAYGDYMELYEEFIFGNLNLSNPKHRKIFLNWRAPDSKVKYYTKYYDKIREEIPHEFQVISDYYNSETEEEHEIFVYDDEYDENNPFVKMMFAIENKKIGEMKVVKGIKMGGEILTVSDAKIKAVVDYFMKTEKLEN